MIDTLPQRKIPLLFMALLAIVFLHQSGIKHTIIERYYYFLGSFLSIIFILIFLFFNQKISVHMAAMASLLFFAMALRVSHATAHITCTIILLLGMGFIGVSQLVI